MRIGIIIIFYNNALDIDKTLLKGLSDLRKHAQLCLVNNASTDKTLEKLQELNATEGFVYTILDIKQNRGIDTAIKAGARYLFNQNELKYIGFINVEGFNTEQSLFDFLSAAESHKDSIVQYNLKLVKNNKMHRVLFKNIFSVVDYLSQMHIGSSKVVKNIN